MRERTHQQTKEELGLDHFEGCSWTGLHRIPLMTMMAYALLQPRGFAAARRKTSLGSTNSTGQLGWGSSGPDDREHDDRESGYASRAGKYDA